LACFRQRPAQKQASHFFGFPGDFFADRLIHQQIAKLMGEHASVVTGLGGEVNDDAVAARFEPKPGAIGQQVASAVDDVAIETREIDVKRPFGFQNVIVKAIHTNSDRSLTKIPLVRRWVECPTIMMVGYSVANLPSTLSFEEA
jgi:hypothetical protein